MDGTCRGHHDRSSAPKSRQALVELAESYLREHAGSSLPLSSVCRMVGVSERGLRSAFYSVRGMSPKRCMLAERLEGVRRALSKGGPITVTSVAMAFGFHELGRFAASYKESFGETPSETLRAAGRKSAVEQYERFSRCLHH